MIPKKVNRRFLLYLTLMFFCGGLALGILLTHYLITGDLVYSIIFSAPFVIMEYVFQYLYRRENEVL